ncbi:hypothetical protein [Pseudalkalibacillus berkeleyi]|uniref:Uncharacterized protein n=1 Tax=Pseudalkalibacillus berkeleyi TaxID=1069813 RepID=A0ABS9H4M2_9BACL|nr:hypothetical protein [Pseudalkalibacillus berkeleyi]MCF6138843.1 hypothetical protein [Pseudalkalibacillus berkeleyi]
MKKKLSLILVSTGLIFTAFGMTDLSTNARDAIVPDSEKQLLVERDAIVPDAEKLLLAQREAIVPDSEKKTEA